MKEETIEYERIYAIFNPFNLHTFGYSQCYIPCYKNLAEAREAEKRVESKIKDCDRLHKENDKEIFERILGRISAEIGWFKNVKK